MWWYLRINVPGKRWNEALSLLRPLLEPTRVQPDCVFCALHQDLAEGGLLWLIEEWASEDRLARHLRSAAFRSVLEAMELSVEPPELRFRRMQDIGGLDTLECMRTG